MGECTTFSQMFGTLFWQRRWLCPRQNKLAGGRARLDSPRAPSSACSWLGPTCLLPARHANGPFWGQNTPRLILSESRAGPRALNRKPSGCDPLGETEAQRGKPGQGGSAVRVVEPLPQGQAGEALSCCSRGAEGVRRKVQPQTSPTPQDI